MNLQLWQYWSAAGTPDLSVRGPSAASCRYFRALAAGSSSDRWGGSAARAWRASRPLAKGTAATAARAVARARRRRGSWGLWVMVVSLAGAARGKQDVRGQGSAGYGGHVRIWTSWISPATRPSDSSSGGGFPWPPGPTIEVHAKDCRTAHIENSQSVAPRAAAICAREWTSRSADRSGKPSPA